MSYINFQTIGVILIVIGTIFTLVDYIQGKSVHEKQLRTIEDQQRTITDLEEKVKPEYIAKNQRDYSLKEFRLALLKGGSLKKYIPEANRNKLIDDDFNLIVGYIENNFSRYNADSIRELVKIVKTQFPNKYYEVIDSSPNVYFSLCPSLVIQYYDDEKNIDNIKSLLKKILLKYLENQTETNHIVFHTIFSEINNDYLCDKSKFNPNEYLALELKDEESKLTFEKGKEGGSLHKNFNKIWGGEFSGLGDISFPWH